MKGKSVKWFLIFAGTFILTNKDYYFIYILAVGVFLIKFDQLNLEFENQAKNISVFLYSSPNKI